MITKSEALNIARKEALRLASMPKYIHRRYETSVFYREIDSAFIYFSASLELLAEDFAPGGFFVYVDKKDGHIWNQTEIKNSVKCPAEYDILQAA